MHDDIGGAGLQPLTITEDMFEAGAMKSAKVDLVCMKVKELAEELEARSASKAGSKPALRHRLRAVIIARELRRAVRRDGGGCSDSSAS